MPQEPLATPQEWAKSYKYPGEQPLASARPGGSVPSSLLITEQRTESKPAASSNDVYRSSFIKLGPDAPKPVPENKYHSIHSLEQSKKIDALKDTKLNPNLIEDGYDHLAHNLHLWTTVGAKAKAAPNISFTEQQQIASNFYDKMIGPAYGHLGMNPMSKDLWLKKAYDEALDYKIEDAYTNNWTNSLKHGWDSGLAATAHVADKLTTMLGDTYNDAVAQWRKERIFANRAADASNVNNVAVQRWDQRLKEIDSQLVSDKKYDENLIQRGARYQQDHRQFWSDVLPGHDGVLNKATSFVGETVGQAPIFAAMELGGAAAGVLGEGTGLTTKLLSFPTGKRVAGYLMAGAKGTAYGVAVRKQDDPGEIWRSAVGFVAFHGLFDVGGVGIKKLIDMFPSGSKELENLKRRQDAYVLAQEGKRPATSVEAYDDHKTEVANNLFVGGIATQRSIYVDALHHVEQMEGNSREEIKAIQARYLDPETGDPAYWSPVLASAKFVRSLLGDKKLSEIESGSENEKFLSSRLAQLIVDAGSEMNTRVHGMGEQAEVKATQNLKHSPATLEFYVQKVQADLAKRPGASSIVKPEQIQKAAEKLYAADLQKSAEMAEKEVAQTKVEKASNIAERRKDTPAVVAIKKNPGFQIRSERSVNKFGEPSARYSVNPNFTVQLKQYQQIAKSRSQTLKQFFQDMDDHDFMHDLAKHFYPDALRDANVFFEGVGKYSSTRDLITPMIDKPFAGKENPNFLAFMYNYTSQMPKEFGEELEQRLIDTMKVQNYMNGRTPTEPQLEYYAKAMYNHMDNFLGSGRWPQEYNIFRSSNANMFKTTQWQRQLLVEKGIQEQKNLKDMFSGDAKALSLALKTHAAFSKLRMDEFSKADFRTRPQAQEHLSAYDDIIADLQTKTGSHERWSF